jgi:Flp pilus assembly protein protease CpaA
MPPTAYLTGAVVLASLVAATCDVRTRRIPNVLTFGMMLLGIGGTLATRGLVAAFVALIIGLAVLLDAFVRFASKRR